MTHYTDELMQIADNVEFFISMDFQPEGFQDLTDFNKCLHFTLDKPEEGEKLNLFIDLVKAGRVKAMCTKYVKASVKVMKEVVWLYLLAFDNNGENDEKTLFNKMLCLTVGTKLLEFIVNLVKLELLELSMDLSEWIVYLSNRSVALMEKIEEELRKIYTA